MLPLLSMRGQRHPSSLPGRLILRAGAALMVVTMVPLFWLAVNHAANIVVVLSLVALVFSLASGIWPSVIAGLFPTKVRFSGIALSYNISMTMLSGFAPLAATLLIEKTQLPAAPALYVAFCAALSHWASFMVRGKSFGSSTPHEAAELAKAAPPR